MKRFRFKIRYIIFCVPVVLLVLLFLKGKPDYNGKYIDSLSYNDEIAKYLLEDIKEFNKKYNGKGGGSVDSDLKIVLYKIRHGDSLWNIAQKTGLSIDTLLTINELDNVHIIQPGTVIRIPNKDGIFYKVSPGETIEDISKRFDVSIEDIININELSEESIKEGEDIFIPKGRLDLQERINYLGRFIMPVFGRITSGFGWRRHPITGRKEFHQGLDIANYYGAPVKASESGKVIFAGEYKGYGKMVIIRHSGGYSTRYAHLSQIKVKHGQYVRQGQLIGNIGKTGVATGPHLHFEIRKYGRALNPFFLLRYFAKR